MPGGAGGPETLTGLVLLGATAELAGRVLLATPVPRIGCGVGVAKRVGTAGFTVDTGAVTGAAEPGPEGTPVAIVTMPGAERLVALAAPAGVAPMAPVALPEADAAGALPLVTATARVGLGALPPTVAVAGAAVSVAFVVVATVQAERIALSAAPAAPLSSMRRENRVGFVSSTRGSSIGKQRNAKYLRPRHIMQ